MKIIFVVLFLLLIGELVYFFYIIPNKKISINKVAPTLTPTLAPEPTKAPTPVSATTLPTKVEFQGKVIEVNEEFTIKVQGTINESKKQFDIIFDQELLSKTKITDLKGKTISYKELKIGQRVKVVEVYNFKEKFYLNSIYEITILN